MKRVLLFGYLPAGTLVCLGAMTGCDATPESAGFGGNAQGTESTASANGTEGSFVGGKSTGTGAAECNSGPNDDYDGDGFKVSDGDCNDCDRNVNPGAIEVIADGVPPADEDCDGTEDNPMLAACDTGLALESSDPMDGARAIELCKQAQGATDWGVVSAQYVRANGQPAPVSEQFGIFANFGDAVSPQQGASMLGLSSGRARLPGQPGACNDCSCQEIGVGTAPPGFPQNAPGCEVNGKIEDDIGLEVNLRAPTNALGYQFDFKFYTFEFAEWVCTDYNDQFMALMNPAPMGSLSGNVSFDMSNNPVSVNIAFFDSCTSCDGWADECVGACPPKPNPCCPAGDTEMQGTGFDVWSGMFNSDDAAGATAWLRTTVPVTAGQTFSLRFAIWDTGDNLLDATAILDNFQWLAAGGMVDVGTTPVPK